MGRIRRAAGASRNVILAIIVFLGMAGVLTVPACTRDTRGFPAMMDMVPGSVNHFSYWNVQTLNKDADLWDIFGRFKESADAQQLGELIAVLASVKQTARAYAYDNSSLAAPATLFAGDFDAASLRSQMLSRGYSKIPQEGIEVWSPGENYTYTRSIALRDGAVYIGEPADIARCVQAAAGKDVLSIRDDPNMRLVSDRLPEGFVVEVHRPGYSVGEYYLDLVGYGKSYSKSNRDTVNVNAVYLFSYDAAARSSQQTIENYSKSLYDGVTTKREGNVIIVKAQVPVITFAQNQFF